MVAIVALSKNRACPTLAPSIELEEQARAVKPLLRWAGGKQHLVREILARFEGPLSPSRYVEPFLGAASVFLGLAPRSAHLSDLNYHLIDFYEELVNNPQRVATELASLASTPVTERRYYEIREQYNASRRSARQAARFVFLNRTCFNGIFRVNRQGLFNVPFGRKFSPPFPNAVAIAAAAELLGAATLQHRGYEDALDDVRTGDSMFLDPPYPPSSKTAYFAHYTTSRFSEFDQHRLAAQVKSLDRAGVRFLMTNADCTLIRRLYSTFRQEQFSVVRWVSCKKHKPSASELIIRNY